MNLFWLLVSSIMSSANLCLDFQRHNGLKATVSFSPLRLAYLLGSWSDFSEARVFPRLIDGGDLLDSPINLESSGRKRDHLQFLLSFFNTYQSPDFVVASRRFAMLPPFLSIAWRKEKERGQEEMMSMLLLFGSLINASH